MTSRPPLPAMHSWSSTSTLPGGTPFQSPTHSQVSLFAPGGPFRIAPFRPTRSTVRPWAPSSLQNVFRPKARQSPDAQFASIVLPNLRPPNPFNHRYLTLSTPTEPLRDLVFTAGAVMKGRGGCAVLYRPGFKFEHGDRTGQVFNDEKPAGFISFSLEAKGPGAQGEVLATADRAALRAVLAALQYWDWEKDGVKVVVLGTSSEYVHAGMVEHLVTWRAAGWREKGDRRLPNVDLWKAVDDEVQQAGNRGLEVQSWLISESENKALTEATRAATEGTPPSKFSRHMADVHQVALEEFRALHARAAAPFARS